MLEEASKGGPEFREGNDFVDKHIVHIFTNRRNTSVVTVRLRDQKRHERFHINCWNNTATSSNKATRHNGDHCSCDYATEKYFTSD